VATILLSYPRSRIIQLDEFGVREVALKDTGHFSVTRDFLNNHEARLRELLGKE
jgi:predicted ATPase